MLIFLDTTLYVCILYRNNLLACSVIAVCIYRLVMISINLSETANCAHWKSETMSETNFFLTIFFSDKIFLRLNFVLDYIPQLYFVCYCKGTVWGDAGFSLCGG